MRGKGGHIKNVMIKFKISQKTLNKKYFIIESFLRKLREYAMKYKMFHL